MELCEMTKHEGGRYHNGERFLPWYTSPCLEWLQTLDLGGKKIFEFGMGDSTKWYCNQGAEPIGVDTQEQWALPLGILAKDKHEYIHIINSAAFYFDIVIIDGLYRDECTEYALKQLKPGGYLILDNYHQASVEPEWPLTDKLIEGMPITIYKEPDHYDWVTAVITKPI